MVFSILDVSVVVIYIIVIYSIALHSNFLMRTNFIRNKHLGINPIENHYLAGKTITFLEALLSILATEFSALAFLTIPTFVYFQNMNFLKFVIGACASRLLIAFFFLPKVYGKGLTIFEALSRGIHGYDQISREGLLGKRVFAFFYVVTKIIGTSVKLLGGAMLIAEFFEISLFLSIVMICSMTYIYIMLGGLKAVVRTDIIQAGVFIVGGISAHYMVGKLDTSTWGELFAFGWNAGKFSLFEGFSGGVSFLYGILAGTAYDAATHGVDQDLVQKLFGSKNLETARSAMAWSALGSFIINFLFLTLGVIVWAYYKKNGLPLPPPNKLFSSLIENYFPSPIKGLMVASILAASMSTLDSAINALSAVFWNDLMSVNRSKLLGVFINLDNFIITVSIVIVSYFFSLIPGSVKIGLQFAYLSTAPLLALFLCRMVLSKYIKINFSFVNILLAIFSCFLGMAINHFRLGFNPHLTILFGIITAIIFMWFYSKLNIFLQNPIEKR
jgi:SSS family solute:Na+ symporter